MVEDKPLENSTIFGDKRIDRIYLLTGKYGLLLMGIFCIILFFVIYPIGLLIIFSIMFFIGSIFFYVYSKKIK